MAINFDTDLFMFSTYNKFEDELFTVMKNVETGEKTFQITKKPQIPVYITREPQTIFREFVNKTEVEEINVSYKWREFDLARRFNIPDFSENLRNGIIKADITHLNKNLYGSDLDIRDYMLMRYMDSSPKKIDERGYNIYEGTPPIKNLHLGYLDIETDIAVSYDREKQPIYMITYIDAKYDVCYTYYLHNDEYTGIDILEHQREKVIQSLIDGVHEDISLAKIKNAKKKKIIQGMMTERINKMKFHIKKYENEADLIKDMWQLIIRKYQPDFLMIFNAEYDISQCSMRAEELGVSLTELFTIPEIGKYINHDYRDRTFNPAERRHNYDSYCLTKIIDNMIIYYCRRKTDGFNSYNLGDTAEREIGIRKLGYGHICSDISELPYTDFVTTYKYNVRDVLLMVFLEDVVRDINYLMSTRFLNRTEYDRVFIPMISVTNSFWHLAFRNNKIYPPNCKNRILARLPDEFLRAIKDVDPNLYGLAMQIKNRAPIEGGLCSDPTKFKGDGKKALFSFMDSEILEDIADEDAKSMYPNALISSYIAMSTLYGIIKMIDNKEVSVNEAYAICTAISNEDIINIGKYMFNLPDMNEILTIIGYNVEEPKPQEFINHTLQYIINRCDKDRFETLDKKLRNIFKPVQTEKDVENDEVIKLRKLYKLSSKEDVDMRYFGTKLTYTIINQDNIKIPSIAYLGITDKNLLNEADEFAIDISKSDSNHKAVNNELLEFINPVREDLPIDRKLVDNYELTDELIQFDMENERNIRLNIEGYKVDLSSRITFITDDFAEAYVTHAYKFKSFTKTKTFDILTTSKILIFSDTDYTNIEIFDKNGYSLVDCFNIRNNRVEAKKDILFKNDFEMHITVNNKKSVLKFNVNRIFIDIYSLALEDKEERETIFMCDLKSVSNLDREHKMNLRQRMYFVQY